MSATPAYHVVLDGQGYLIDPSSYRRRPAARTAPKTRTGDESYGDFVNGSVWSQSSWAEGFGFDEWDKSKNTQLADANGVDTSRGDLRPGRPTVGPAAAGLWQMVTFRGALYGIDGNTANVYATFDGANWSVVVNLNTISAATTLRSMAVSAHGGPQAYLFVGAGDSGKIYRFDGATWILWTTVPNATAIHALADVSVLPYDQFGLALPTGTASMLVAGASQATPTGAALTMSELVTWNVAGSTVDWLGSAMWPHVEAISGTGQDIYWSAGDLTAGEGGLYLTHYGGGNSTGNLLASSTRLVTRLPDNIITAFTHYAGKLLGGSHTRGRLWSVTTDGIEEFFHVPENARPGTPPMYVQRMNQLVLYDGRLYVPMLDVQGLCAYQFDGTGWCRINVGIASQSEARGLATFANQLYLAGATGVYRFPAIYNNSGSGGTAITPWFDADLPTLGKGFTRVTLAHSVLETGESIAVAYGLDDATGWTTLGTANVAGASTTVLPFPAGVAGRRLRYRFTFTLTNTLHGQRLRSFITEYALAAEVVTGDPAGEPPTDDHVKTEFVFEALLEGTFEHPLVRLDRSVEPKTGDELRRALWASKAEPSTSVYRDTDGQTYHVSFTDLEDRLVKEHAAPRQGWRGTVRLTEL